MFYLYMIENSVGKLYVGITKDPYARVGVHNAKQGAKFTKYVPNFEIVFLESHESMMGARSREIQIKKWRREKKEMLISKYRNGLNTKI